MDVKAGAIDEGGRVAGRALASRGGAAQSSCRFCGADLEHVFVDLGASPIANAYLEPADLGEPETFYPLKVFVCAECLLVQVQDVQTRERIFADDYAYFSSYSASWLAHSRAYVEAVVERFGLRPGHRIVEVASNDGYLLQYFRDRGFEVLGIDPAASVAEAAALKGVPTIRRFFGGETARELALTVTADLLIANNVLAHVPDLNDFVAGMKLALAEGGVITVELPHLLHLVEDAQFDTIYHEHFSYISFLVACKLFARHGLTVFDVEELRTHGGSLRIYACHTGNDSLPVTDAVSELAERERRHGFGDLATYRTFAAQARQLKFEALRVLLEIKAEGATIVGYGAPAKGNTFLNYCGIGPEFLDYTVDISPHKQGMYLPGTRIPIEGPERIAQTRPDYVLILPWNLREEVMDQLSFIRNWGGRFITRTPKFEVLP